MHSTPSTVRLANLELELAKRLPANLSRDEFRHAFYAAALDLGWGTKRIIVHYRRTNGHSHITGVEFIHPDSMPYMARRIDLGTFDLQADGEPVFNEPDFVSKLRAQVDRAKASEREVRRLNGMTIAQYDADGMRSDPREGDK